MNDAKTASPAATVVTEETGNSAAHNPPARQFNIPLAYLRAFIIVLVVAHHAAVGYNVIAPETAATSLSEHFQSMRGISPVLDAQRSGLLSLFTSFNDTFMMALLFFLSGLFVWRSLQRRGSTTYLRDRLIRLGIPLVVMILLRPLTHYPTYLQSGGSGGLADFWQQWSATAWRGGPLWFLELLLLFDIVLVLAASLKVNASAVTRRLPTDFLSRPVRAFVVLVLLSAVAYVPLSAVFGSFFWLQIGPAQIQVNRVLFYAIYFLAGVAFGAYGLQRTFVVTDSGLTRRWPPWTAAAIVLFLVNVVLSLSIPNEALVGSLYVLTCAAISFAFLALFLRFARTQRKAWDSLFQNSYGIYLIHYGIVSYLLFAMLDVQLPAMVKWLVVFVLALALCWGITAAIRRIPGVARVI